MQDKKREEKKQQRKREKILVMAVSVLIGMAAGVGIAFMMDKVIPENEPVYVKIGSVTLLLLMFYISVVLHIFIHETGHMVFGLITRYCFVSIRFFNIMFVKQKDKLQIKKMSLHGTGGQCLMNPPAIDGSSPTALYHWGGCILNIVFGLLSLLCMFVFRSNKVAFTVFLVFGFCGVTTAVLNGLPLRSLGNDGYNAMILSKCKDARIAMEKVLFANNAQMNGIRVKDMPWEWFTLDGEAESLLNEVLFVNKEPEEIVLEEDEQKLQRLRKIISNNLVASLVLLRMNFYMDIHDFEKAYRTGRFLLRNVQMVELQELSIKAELLYMEMIGEGRKQQVEEILDNETKQKIKMLDTMPAIHRVWYAYYTLYEPDQKKAEKAKKDFEKLAVHYPYASDIELERELLQIVDDRKASVCN